MERRGSKHLAQAITLALIVTPSTAFAADWKYLGETVAFKIYVDTTSVIYVSNHIRKARGKEILSEKYPEKWAEVAIYVEINCKNHTSDINSTILYRKDGTIFARADNQQDGFSGIKPDTADGLVEAYVCKLPNHAHRK